MDGGGWLFGKYMGCNCFFYLYCVIHLCNIKRCNRIIETQEYPEWTVEGKSYIGRERYQSKGYT